MRLSKNESKKTAKGKKRAFAFLLFTILTFPLLCSGASKETGSIIPALNEPLQQSQIIRLSLKSTHMRMKVPFMVYLPKGYGGGDKYPVWYGLHGYSSSEKMWLEYAGVGKIADEMAERGEIRPMIMVFPLTRYDSTKVIQEDMRDGKRDACQMERFMIRELIPYIDSHFHTIQAPEGRYIGGFSMGGFFALEIAFHHPDLFGKVGGYSPALIYSDFSSSQFEKWMYPANDAWKTQDKVDFFKESGLDRLQVFLDCGSVNDPFAEGVASLSKALQERGVSVDFRPHEGGHTLLMDKVAGYLLFYCSVK